jgi:hypothetical protein
MEIAKARRNVQDLERDLLRALITKTFAASADVSGEK